MASGHVSRINRPNTWLLRPDLRREESPCQHGAVHTWHTASVRCGARGSSGIWRLAVGSCRFDPEARAAGLAPTAHGGGDLYAWPWS